MELVFHGRAGWKAVQFWFGQVVRVTYTKWSVIAYLNVIELDRILTCLLIVHVGVVVNTAFVLFLGL